MAIAFKRQSLSQAEQDAKNRFYGDQKQQNSPPTKDKLPEKQKNIQKGNGQNPQPSEQGLSVPQQPKSQFQAAYNAPSNQQIDQFYKNLETDFKQVAQKQVTMGMLVNQQELMKQQQEILFQNQQQMQQFAQNQNASGKSGIPQTNTEQQTMMHLLQPINQQLSEIKALYQQTQQSQLEIRSQIQQQNGNVNLQQYDAQNNQLKTLLETTQHNLSFLRPENLQTLQNFTNFNLQLYQDTINNLQSQITALQTEAQTSEQELHVRYKQLNDAHMVRKIQKVQQYEEETMLQLEKQISQINFEKSQQYINQRLGGAYDYDQLYQDIADLSNQAQIIFSKFMDDGLNFEMFIPEFQFDASDIEALNNRPISILDEMKAALGIFNKPPPIQQKVQAPIPQIQTFGEMQKQTNKPAHLTNLQTKPVEPPKDIKFEKQQTPSKYEPIFKPQLKEQPESKKKQQKPINQDKLEFRKLQQPQKDKKNYGVIEYLDNDQSMEEPKYEITYKQKEKQEEKRPLNQQQLKAPTFHSEVQESEKINSQNVESHKPQEYKETYNYQDIRHNYQEGINEPKFINYDELIHEIQQTNNYTSQEQKSGALLERLGVRQENPQNEFDLIELLSRDIVKDKLVQHKQQNIQAQEMINKEKILKNQSVQIQPEQNLQDQIATGAQAFFQGLLTAFNSTLNQVNDGLSGNVTQQARQLVKIQQQIESSNYSDTEEEEERYNKEFQQQQEKALEKQVNKPKQPINKPAPFQNTQVLQQYTFASTFQQQSQQQLHQQQRDGGQKKPEQANDYLNQFLISDNSQISQNKSGGSYAGSIFRLDDSYGHKSEGQVSINEGKISKRGKVTQDIFQGLNQDLSDSDIPQYKTKPK